MERVLVLASHHKMAEGLKDTLEFITGDVCHTIALAAYVDNSPIEDAIKNIMEGIAEEEEVVILTDLTSGSVNQQFFAYRNRPHTHIISGMNLPLAMQFALEPQEDYMSADTVRELVVTAQQEIKYVSDMTAAEDEEDE